MISTGRPASPLFIYQLPSCEAAVCPFLPQLSNFQGVMLQRLTSSGLMGKMGYPSYTPAVSCIFSLWQVLAPALHLSA